jgi:hypothetical protein
MLKYKHQCHCACSLEIGTCIINDVGRPAAHKKQRKYTFFGRISPYDGLQCFILMFWRYILTFNAKTNFKKNTKLTGTIPLNITTKCWVFYIVVVIPLNITTKCWVFYIVLVIPLNITTKCWVFYIVVVIPLNITTKCWVFYIVGVIGLIVFLKNNTFCLVLG